MRRATAVSGAVPPTKGAAYSKLRARDEYVCEWRPEPHHLAFDGILNGGICGALLDCHSNWTAAYHLMKKAGADTPPSTVTAEFHVKLKRITPMDTTLQLRARVTESTENTAVVDAEIVANGKVTSTCRRGRARASGLSPLGVNTSSPKSV